MKKFSEVLQESLNSTNSIERFSKESKIVLDEVTNIYKGVVKVLNDLEVNIEKEIIKFGYKFKYITYTIDLMIDDNKAINIFRELKDKLKRVNKEILVSSDIITIEVERKI